MAAPEGYTKLGTVGIAYKGEYDTSKKAEYKAMNWVTHEGSAYLALKDSPESEPTESDESGYWKLLAKKGETGDKGDTGATPKLTIGEVTTGEPGGNASAEITSDDPANPKLNLTIPRGNPGEVTIEALNAAVAAATSRHWDITVGDETHAWETASSEQFAGLTAAFKVTAECEGMTADTDISGIAFIGGNRTAAATWQWLAPGENSVTLYAATKPIGQFNLRLTEVK